MPEPILTIEHLTKRFDDLTVLKDLDLTVHEGEVIVIVGPSGCGKSTLLRCINALEPIQGGQIRLRGERISQGARNLAGIRQKIGIVFQSYELFPHLTVLENLLLAPMKVQKRSRSDARDEALALLSQYDMHASANSCYHFQIADAAGRAVVVEYIGDEMNVVESPRATNFLLTEGDWDFGRGQDRFAVLEETMEASGGVLTEEEGMALLQAVSQQPQPGKDSSTQWSCLYNQVRGTVDIAVAMDYDSLYHFAIDE